MTVAANYRLTDISILESASTLQDTAMLPFHEASMLTIKQHPFKTGLLLIGAILLGFFIYICLPHGYTQLSALESNLNRVTADGMSISEVRSGLDGLGIKYYESVQLRTGPLLQVGSEVKISANAGQQVLVTRVDTGAWQFPCSEQLDVVIVFDNHGRVVRRYVGRFHACP